MSSITAVLAPVLLASAFPLYFQDGKTAPGTAPTPGSQPPKTVTVGSQQTGGLLLQRGERLVGTDLFDNTGARLGKIDDLVFDAKGSVSHVVIQGDVGGQPRLVPIPWNTLSFPETFQPGMESPTDKVTTNFSSTRLEMAPHFTSDQWPKDGVDPLFSQSDTFFQSMGGVEGGRTPVAPVNASASIGPRFRASRMRNLGVMDDAGKPLGSLGQFVIDSRTGRITYATMTVDSPSGTSPRVIAVPWDTFTASRQNDRDQLRLGLPMERLQAAPEFQAGTAGWKQMSDPAWVSTMYSYYSARPYWNERPMGGTPGSKPAPANKPTTPTDKGKPSRP